MKTTWPAVALVALIATGVAACGSSQSGSQRRAGHNSTTATAPQGNPNASTVNPGSGLPNVAEGPGVRQAEQAVAAALAAVNSAAAAVGASGSDSALGPAMADLNRDFAVVQQQSNLAFSAGAAGNCGDSFAASRAAADASKATRHDLEALSRQVGDVHRARAKYATARQHALTALQNLYNAIAGHPLSTGPSAVVDQLHAAIAAADRGSASAVAQASGILAAGRASVDSARKVAKNAALAPCLVST